MTIYTDNGNGVYYVTSSANWTPRKETREPQFIMQFRDENHGWLRAMEWDHMDASLLEWVEKEVVSRMRLTANTLRYRLVRVMWEDDTKFTDVLREWPGVED